MKTYRSHKIVEAAPILAVRRLDAQDEGAKAGYAVDFGFTEAELRCREFPYQWSAGAPYEPKVGDYVVKYSDDYYSISPKAAFEAGYTEVAS